MQYQVILPDGTLKLVFPSLMMEGFRYHIGEHINIDGKTYKIIDIVHVVRNDDNGHKIESHIDIFLKK